MKRYFVEVVEVRLVQVHVMAESEADARKHWASGAVVFQDITDSQVIYVKAA
jgi:hypothetical protein